MNTNVHQLPPEAVAKNVRDWETLIRIFWIIIAVCQICSIVLAPCGAWNLFVSIRKLKLIKSILPGQQWVVRYYNNAQNSLIISGAINLVFGGVVGVILVGAEFIVRDYVLKHRYAFTAQS